MWVPCVWNWKENKSFVIHEQSKAIGRREEELRNEIRSVKTVNNSIKIEFGLKNYAIVSLKTGSVHRGQHVGSTVENGIKDLKSI